MRLGLGWLLLMVFTALPADGAEDLLTETEARARAARVSDVSYDVTLAFASGAERYGGDVAIRFRLSDAGAPLALDFRSSGVKRIVANGRELAKDAADGK